MDFNETKDFLEHLDDLAIDDEVFIHTKRGFLEAAVRYANIRAEWALQTLDERRAINERRTAAHNAFIDRCNILGRYMYMKGKDASWREGLGHDRKDIGDFACLIHAVLGISAR